MRFDAVVLGAGPAGEVAVSALSESGMRCALVERELIGGECTKAWAVAPLAGEWIHVAALAIKAEIQLATLRDTIVQFPSFSEAYLSALRALPS